MSFIKCFFGVLNTQESFHKMCTIVIIVNIPSVMYHIGFFFPPIITISLYKAEMSSFKYN